MKPAARPADSPATGGETTEVGWIDEHRERGVRALVPFAAGDAIHRFTGETVSEIGQHTLQISETQHISGTSIIGYLSHGCAPNCRLDMARFELVATRDIAAGEVLTIDYALTEDKLFRQFACHCGDVDCRRWIIGRAEPISAEGQAYLQRLAADPSSPAMTDGFWWRRDDLGYADGRLHFAGHDVAALAETVEGPLFLYSAARVAANIARVRAAMASTGMPHRLYYAMKANRCGPLLRALARDGHCGVDICSPNELRLALDSGFAPAQISFTGTGVANRDLDRLLAQPELTINCDSIGMIRRIGERQPGRAIGIRINAGIGTGYGDAVRLSYAGETTTKFGIYREQWAEALAMARRHRLPVTSLHFHVGCGYLDGQLDRWSEAVGASLDFLKDLPEVITVNIGGGLGVPHRARDAALDLAHWAGILAGHFKGRGVTIAAEPGDYLVKDAGMLVLSVVDIERKRDTVFVSVDGGFNLAPEPAYYDLPCEPVACVPRSMTPRSWRKVSIAGNINEALDLWAVDHPMPDLREGDRIAFLNAGGYGAAMSSNHCMRGAFTEKLLDG
ncbi:MAG TPA: SET domain-containing protein-lysine N-methyltransferase [Magnetospirillaceae bacterium]